MARCIQFFRRARFAFLTAAIALSANPAWAEQVEAAKNDQKQYPLMYLLVVLLIAFGLLLVLRPVDREKEIRKNLP